MFRANTHHCHVVQHATIHPPFIKLRFILRQTNVIQPSWEEEEVNFYLVKLVKEGKRIETNFLKLELYFRLAAGTHS